MIDRRGKKEEGRKEGKGWKKGIMLEKKEQEREENRTRMKS